MGVVVSIAETPIDILLEERRRREQAGPLSMSNADAFDELQRQLSRSWSRDKWLSEVRRNRKHKTKLSRLGEVRTAALIYQGYATAMTRCRLGVPRHGEDESEPKLPRWESVASWVHRTRRPLDRFAQIGLAMGVVALAMTIVARATAAPVGWLTLAVAAVAFILSLFGIIRIRASDSIPRGALRALAGAMLVWAAATFYPIGLFGL